MNLKILTVVVSSLGFATGCKQSTVTDDTPARIINPSEAGRAELQEIVTTALDNDHISIGADAFTRSSFLNLEHPPVRDAQGALLMGRDLGRPVQFRLVLNGRDCVLIQSATGERWLLRESECVKE